ncbi:unnamed protein product [Lactuca virosa]|uniref:Uncharacterized protein n=1 Tax=Lactuca virosa TaxID=75947 RepID=A0AAU9ML27_9ASTR|nr:unnamed protein product [Lactuca virosa]
MVKNRCKQEGGQWTCLVVGAKTNGAGGGIWLSIDLSSTTTDVLSSELCKRLKGFLAAWPPSSPQPHSKKHRIHSLDSTNEVKRQQLSSPLASLPIIASTASGSSIASNLSFNRRRQLLVRRHLVQSSIDLSSTTTDVLSSELCKRLKGFLAAWRPSSPQPHVNELLIAKGYQEPWIEDVGGLVLVLGCLWCDSGLVAEGVMVQNKCKQEGGQWTCLVVGAKMNGAGGGIWLSIDLSSTTTDVLSSELCKRLKGFLAAWPPSSPQPHVNELLIAKGFF